MSAETPSRRAGTALRAAGLLTVTAFIVLLVYGVLAQAPNSTIDDALAQERRVPAPGFELAVLADGEPGKRLVSAWRRAAANKRVDFAELRGTPVVLNFWASWCDPCRTEAPVLRRAAERWRNRGVLYLGLDMQDVTEDARAFLAEYKLGFPQVRDPTNATARRWGVSGIPETFFISARGDVVGHVIGTVTSEQLDAGAAAAQAGRPQSAARGGEQRQTR